MTSFKFNAFRREASFGLLFLILGLSGCGNGDRSTTTTWFYGNPKGLAFKSIDHNGTPPPGMVFVPGGSFVMGATQESVALDPDNVPKYASVSSFYMDEIEVPNVSYCEYLNWMAKVFAQSNPATYRSALPDTSVWRNGLSFNEPHVNDYLRHPAFKYYPVVGVSWVQANQYCEWRTDRVNEQRLIDAGYIKYSAQSGEQHFTTKGYLAGFYRPELTKAKSKTGINGDLVYPVTEDGFFTASYRLPSEAEWEYAAQGLVGRTESGLIAERRVYPWNERGIRSGPGRRQGNYYGNFKHSLSSPSEVVSYDITRGGPTAPGKYYRANDFGLYNMAGNVNEWVADLYRPASNIESDAISPFMGGGYTRPQYDEEGNLAKDSAGRVIMIADDRRYSDDLLVSYLDSITISANPNGQVNNRNRVYKGGSYRDMPYWVTPGARRFFNESKGKDDIGFRCAMIGLGRPRGQR